MKEKNKAGKGMDTVSREQWDWSRPLLVEVGGFVMIMDGETEV